METKHYKEKIRGLILLCLLCCVIITLVKPIPQQLCYHSFADQREYFSIPNFWNVFSNLPYFIVGILGFIFLPGEKGKREITALRINYFCFFLGVFFTGFGSAYYHWQPSNPTLVWDRLPMTLTFMSFVSIIIGEYISVKWSKILLAPLLLVGLASVLYWIYTEGEGKGDLRLYALVQFLPMIVVPLILLLFKPIKRPIKYVWYVLLAYLIAKLFEAGDGEIYKYSPFLSGHTLKHFAAGATPFLLWLGLKRQGK